MSTKNLVLIGLFSLLSVGARGQGLQVENSPTLSAQNIQLQDLPYLENNYRYTLQFGEFLIGIDLYHKPENSQFHPETVGFQMVIPFNKDRSGNEDLGMEKQKISNINDVRTTPKIFLLNKPMKMKLEGLVYNEFDKLVAALSFKDNTGNESSLPVQMTAGGLLKTQIEMKSVSISVKGLSTGEVFGKGKCVVRQKTFLPSSQPQWREVGCEVKAYYNSKTNQWDGSVNINDSTAKAGQACTTSAAAAAERLDALFQQYKQAGQDLPDSLLIPETWMANIKWDRNETVTKAFAEAFIRPEGHFENRMIMISQNPTLAVDFNKDTLVWTCYEQSLQPDVKNRIVMHFLAKKKSFWSGKEKIVVKGVDISVHPIQGGLEHVSFLKKIFGKLGSAVKNDILLPLENAAQTIFDQFGGANVETVILEEIQENGNTVSKLRYKIGSRILDWNLVTGSIETTVENPIQK